MQVFNVFPTALEISLVGGILTYNFGPAFGVLTLGTIGTYTAFTFATTQWRIQFRRQVRENGISSFNASCRVSAQRMGWGGARERSAELSSAALCV